MSDSGMHLGYNLVALDLLDGQTTVLDNDSTLVAGGADMHACISGDGNLLIDATSAIHINNSDNTYTGTTFVTSGTLATLNTGALFFNGGALTIENGGTSAGALSGEGTLNLTGGNLLITWLAATTNIAASATATLNHASGLGDAGATLEYHNVDGALTNTVNGSGTMRIASSELAIEHDDTIANSMLENALVYISATQALGSDTATVRADANSALIVRLDGAHLGHVALDGAKLGFAHDTPAFHRATLASLAGSNATLIFNTDFTDVSGLKQPGEVADHLTVRVNALGGLPSSDETAIPLITEAGGANGSAIYQLDSGKLEFGLTEYSLGTGATADTTLALDPRTWYLYSSGLSQVADAIIDTAALLAKDWHYSLDALYLRMGDVRQENLLATDSSSAKGTGNLWLRARGYQLNATSPLSGHGVTQYAYGMTAGGDKAFGTETGVNLLGAFLDMGRINRDFGANSDGSTNSISAGLYATLLKRNGWHADFVVKADRYRHTFNVSTITGRPAHGSYTTLAFGASIELGRRFGRADGWWVEPAVQASMAWLDGARYRTTPDNVAIDVKVNNVAAAQYRGMLRFGRQIKDTRWTPYGKLGLAKTDTDGGAIHAHNRDFKPNFDSWRAEFGFGTSYRLNAASQLYLDYEYGKAAAYERPWALNFGYRRLW